MTLRWALLMGGFTAVALADPGKVARDLAGAAPGSMAPVIVRYTQPPGSLELNELSRNGGWIKRALPGINAMAAVVPAAQLARLAADSRVAYISPDRAVRRSMDRAVPASTADVAQRLGWTGRGVTVAVIDSGIAEHQDFRDGRGGSRVVYRENLLTPSGRDRYGHGTHVAGIIAGSGAASAGALRGIAPDAHLVDLTAL